MHLIVCVYQNVLDKDLIIYKMLGGENWDFSYVQFKEKICMEYILFSMSNLKFWSRSTTIQPFKI